MKKIVWALDDAGLKEGEPCKGSLVFVTQSGDVIPHDIKPMIFLVGIVDVLEIIGYKSGIVNAGMLREQIVDIAVTQQDRIVFNDGLTYDCIKWQDVIVCHSLTCVFQFIRYAACSAKSVQSRVEPDFRHFGPYPVDKPGLAPLIARGGEAVHFLNFGFRKQ